MDVFGTGEHGIKGIIHSGNRLASVDEPGTGQRDSYRRRFHRIGFNHQFG